MPDVFDGYQFLSHLRARWRLVALVVGVALAISLAGSLLLPKRYTGKVSLVIEAPAGADPRGSTAVSPVYLESLKTYEHFASSNQLFAQAAERFQLRRASWRSLEGLKRAVLEVTIPRNTKVLEIAATLPEARQAHALALYLAEETIKLNRKTSRAGDEERIAEARSRLEQAAKRLQAADVARSETTRRAATPEALRAELSQLRSLREEVDRLALSAQLAERAKTPADRLQRQGADLDRQIGEKQQALARRTTELESVAAEYESAYTAVEELEKRLRETEAAAGYRGERLDMLDPGVIPERPSFPNLPLNLVVAAALALIATLVFLTLEFGLQAHRAETMRKGLRVASKS